MAIEKISEALSIETFTTGMQINEVDLNWSDQTHSVAEIIVNADMVFAVHKSFEILFI